METPSHELHYSRYGLAPGLYSPPRYVHRTQHSRNPLITPTSPPGPSTFKRDRILVVVTADAERYTPVDVTDSLHDGPTIRTRICNKLGILDPAEQAQSLIFETEIGSEGWGHSLNDDNLSSMCRERADTKGSLAFIVERPGSRRVRRGRSSPLSPDYQSSDIESTASDHSNAGTLQTQSSNHSHRRRNRSHTVDSRTQPPQPPLTPDSAHSLTNGPRSPPQRPAQPREPSNSTSPTSVSSGGSGHTTNLVLGNLNGINGIHPSHTHGLPRTPDDQSTNSSHRSTSNQHQPPPPPPELSPPPQQSSQPRTQRRPVRPLPAIPTPTSAPSPGPPLSSGADHYPRSISMTSTTGGTTHSTSPNNDIEDFYA